MKGSTLVERSFKLRYGLKLCFFATVGLLAVTVFLYFVTYKELGTSYATAIYTLYDIKIRLLPLFFASSYSIAILAIVTALVAMDALLFSHKIAGPIYRIEKNLADIRHGDLTVTTRFRGNDQLRAFEQELNDMVRALNHMARGLDEAAARVKMREQELEDILLSQAPAKEDIAAAVNELRLSIEDLKKAALNVKVKEQTR